MGERVRRRGRLGEKAHHTGGERKEEREKEGRGGEGGEGSRDNGEWGRGTDSQGGRGLEFTEIRGKTVKEGK